MHWAISLVIRSWICSRREKPQDPGELGNADDPVARQVCDRGAAGDRRKMMFAMGLEGNVLQQDDFVISGDLAEGSA
jgi:hypothetical protein